MSASTRHRCDPRQKPQSLCNHHFTNSLEGKSGRIAKPKGESFAVVSMIGPDRATETGNQLLARPVWIPVGEMQGGQTRRVSRIRCFPSVVAVQSLAKCFMRLD